MKERVSEVDFLTASMALRRAPLLSRLTSAAGSTFPAAAAYGLLAAGEKSIYSLYNSLLRLQPGALALNPAAVAAAAAMVRPPTMTVFPSPLAVAPSAPATPRAAGDSESSSEACKSSSAAAAGGIVQTNALLNGGHRYRPYMPPASLATVAKRLDANTVRQSN